MSDIESFSLVARLALEDLEASYGRRGKARVGSTPSDEEFALRLQAEQFQQWITMAEDTRMATSLHAASESDVAYLEAYAIAEQAAIEDRQAALALSRGQPLPPRTANQSRLDDPTFKLDLDPDTLMKTRNGKSRDFDTQDEDEDMDDGDDDDDDASSITIINNQHSIAREATIQKSFVTPMAGPSVNRTTPANCLICDERVSVRHALQTPCGHFYCRDCAVDLVQAFTRDESLYPLRCCKTAIPATSIVPLISLTLKKTFDAKNAEWGVLAKDRIYCSNPTCSAFLGSAVDKMDLAGVRCTSAQCRTNTCPRCKQVAHPNELDCSANVATEQVRALARQQGWQTCPGCHTIVELNVGCYHMTCRCRTQFCYVCAVPWKDCECPHWDDHRLIATAEQRLENQMGARAGQMRNDAPQLFQQQVQRVAETLRENHNCITHNWRYRHGSGCCEECHCFLPKFLMMCTRCSLLACARCSRNRL